jgi:hypothetical protein
MLIKSILFLSLSITYAIFNPTIADSKTLDKSMVLVSNGTTDEYQDYSIYVDTKSIQSITKDKKKFNLVTYGLSFDGVSSDLDTKDDSQSDFVNQDMMNITIHSEMKCSEKELKPISFEMVDLRTGYKVTDSVDKIMDSEDYQVDADKITLDNIHKLVCKK